MSVRYREITEHLKLEKNQVRAIYLNCFFSAISVSILIFIVVMLDPLTKDASILIHHANDKLNEFSNLIPEFYDLIPVAKNTTEVLTDMIPKINKAMDILHQICEQDPVCHQ